jgi:hypothetical protein
MSEDWSGDWVQHPAAAEESWADFAFGRQQGMLQASVPAQAGGTPAKRIMTVRAKRRKVCAANFIVRKYR